MARRLITGGPSRPVRDYCEPSCLLALHLPHVVLLLYLAFHFVAVPLHLLLHVALHFILVMLHVAHVVVGLSHITLHLALHPFFPLAHVIGKRDGAKPCETQHSNDGHLNSLHRVPPHEYVYRRSLYGSTLLAFCNQVNCSRLFLM